MLFNVFEPKLVDSLLYAMIDFFNHGIQDTATWSQLSLVPRLYITKLICSDNVHVLVIIFVNNDMGVDAMSVVKGNKEASRFYICAI